MKTQKRHKKYQLVYPDGRGKESVNFYSIVVFRNGKIVNKNTGRELSRISMNGKRSHITMFFEKKRYSLNISRTVYSIFSGKKIGRDDIVQYHDGDEDNKSFDNLYILSRKEHYDKLCAQNKTVRGHEKMFNNEKAEEIRKEYQELFPQTSYRKLAVKHGCSTFTIQQIIKGVY